MRQYDKDSTQSWAGLARGGVMGGLVGGIVMAMIMMVATAANGMGFLRPLYLIAATFHQAWAMAQGVQIGPVFIGLMLHMMNAAVFGLIFALLLGAVTRDKRAGMATWVIAGMVWGVVLLVVNQYVVLRIVDPAMATATATGAMPAWWVVSHLMYGVVVGTLVAALAGSSAARQSVARRAA